MQKLVDEARVVSDGDHSKMKTSTAEETIKETRRAAMIVGAMADMLSSEVDLELLSEFDRRELGAIWDKLHQLNNSLQNWAYAWEEENLQSK